MFNEPTWRISNNLVRLVLFRVLPGREVEVGRRIEERCDETGVPRSRFRIFRLFGSYDLAFIQDASDLRAAELARLGTIPGITGSTEYVCYSWMRDGSELTETFNLERISEPLLGLCFLKINPLLTQRHGLRPEILCAEHVAKEDPAVQVLGTLGWAEMLLLISDNSLKRILERIRSYFPALILSAPNEGRDESLPEKTLTIVGHVLSMSDPTIRNSPIVRLEPDLLKKRSLEVHFSASCTPSSMAELQAYADDKFKLAKKEPRITFRLGARDLDFEVPLSGIKTLNQLISRLDDFRAHNASALIRTHTELQYRIGRSEWAESKSAARKTLVLDIRPEEAKHLISLGPEGASSAAAIYHFNNLIENRLLLDTFVDLSRAVARLKDKAVGMVPPLSVSARWGLATRLQYLQQAVSQRYQGAYVGVEESPWGASFGIQAAGVGVQRILKALEFYAIELLSRLGKRWSGFALIGRHTRPAMEHFEDILLVPAADALDAGRHWALSHEIMHVLQNIDPDRFSLRSLTRDLEIIPPNDTTRSAKLLVEATADIMEYQLSCTLSVNEYTQVVWAYLKQGLFEQTSEDQLTSYLIRSFSVFYSTESEGAAEALSPTRLEELFQRFTKLIEACGISMARLLVEDARGQVPLQLALQEFVLDVLPYLAKINRCVSELKSRTSPHDDDNLTASECADRLSRGEVLRPHELSRPDAIAWELARRSLTPDRQVANTSRQTITWILSLWHAYHVQKRGPDLDQLITPFERERGEP